MKSLLGIEMAKRRVWTIIEKLKPSDFHQRDQKQYHLLWSSADVLCEYFGFPEWTDEHWSTILEEIATPTLRTGTGLLCGLEDFELWQTILWCFLSSIKETVVVLAINFSELRATHRTPENGSGGEWPFLRVVGAYRSSLQVCYSRRSMFYPHLPCPLLPPLQTWDLRQNFDLLTDCPAQTNGNSSFPPTDLSILEVIFANSNHMTSDKTAFLVPGGMKATIPPPSDVDLRWQVLLGSEIV
jgi:hypothetical protein